MQIGNFQITRGQMIMVGAIIVIILLISSVFFGILPGSRTSQAPQTTLKFWGLYDDGSVWQPLFDAYRKENPNTSFDYVKKDPATYETDLVNALASGQAPDIIMFHSSWLAKHGNKILPLPESLMTLRDFQETFPDVATVDFVANSQIYALPVWTDTLVMYYNKDLFNTAGIAVPPKTWDEFIKIVAKLSAKDRNGNLTKSGVALGTAGNIDNAADILSLLMLQSGTKMINDRGDEASFDDSITVGNSTYSPGESALRFYTDFANPKSSVYSWNGKMVNAFDAFASGQTAVMFDYAVNISMLKQKAPNLRLGIASVPQLSSAGKAVNFASFWGYSVPSASKNSSAAWNFIKYLTNYDPQKYFASTALRAASRRDVISEELSSPDLGVFAGAILSAVDWYRIDPDKINDIFKEMINAVTVGGGSPAGAISDAASKVTFLMKNK